MADNAAYNGRIAQVKQTTHKTKSTAPTCRIINDNPIKTLWGVVELKNGRFFDVNLIKVICEKPTATSPIVTDLRQYFHQAEPIKTFF